MIFSVSTSEKSLIKERAFFKSIPIWIRSTAFVLWFILIFDWTILRDVETVRC